MQHKHWGYLALLCLFLFPFSQAQGSQKNRKHCRRILKVKTLASKHRLPLKQLNILEQLYCSKGKHLRKRRRIVGAFEIYNSDSCSSSYLQITVGPMTNCSLLPAKGRGADGIKVNGKCINIPDTNQRAACERYRGFLFPAKRRYEVYDSSQCGSNQLKAVIGPDSDCQLFPDKGHDAEGLKVDGKCINIDDTNQQDACERYKGFSAPPRRRVKLYNSDSCTSSLLKGVISVDSRCQYFSAKGRDADGVKNRGKCINIPDTNLQAACTQYVGLSTPRSQQVWVYDSNSCSANYLKAVMTPWTRCATFPSKGHDAEGIKVHGKCINIDDTHLSRACLKYQNQANVR